MRLILKITSIATTLILFSCYSAANEKNGFRIDAGDEFQYELVKIDDGDEFVTKKISERAVESSNKAGHACVEYKSFSKRDTNSRYCRTDSTGLYFYFDKYINNYSELFPELNDFWLKYIDFQNKEWTQFSFVHDSTHSEEHTEKLELDYSGKYLGEIEVELYGEKYKATVTRSSLTSKKTIDYMGDTSVYDSEIAMEYTYINGVGLYKIQRIYDGELVDSFQVLKNITKK